jgi:HEAT repeat protein
MPIAGGATALVVVAFFGWKLLHNSGINPDDAAALPSQPGLAQSASVPGVKQPRASTPLPPTSAAEQQTVTITGWIKALKAGDVVARRNAARALNSFGPEANTALPGLHAALKDTDAEVRTWSALALIDHKSYDKAIVPILVQALQQDDALLRQVSCLSLAVIPHEEADKESIVPALATTAGQDADADVRKAAVSALNIIAPELVSREASK